jgi:hypothetical protein
MVRNQRFVVSVPEEGVKLGKPFKISIRPSATFKGDADYSIVMAASSYNSKYQFGTLKTATGSGAAGAIISITEADWAQDWLKKYVPTLTNTLDVIIVARPKTGGAAYMKHVMIPVIAPRLAMLCGRKERAFKKDQTIACNVQFYNPLPYKLNDVVMSFSISGQPTQQAQQKQSLAPSAVNWQDTESVEVDSTSRSTFQARFHLKGATGKQVIIAKLSSRELDGVAGIMEITINA